MRVKARLIFLSLLAGITVWVFDAVVDMLYFYDESFLSLFLLDVPLHEVYFRTVVIVVFLGFGLTAAWLVGNLESREADLELFRTLIDEANDSVFVIDPQSGELLDVNATACDLLGYERAELLTKTVADISPAVRDHQSFQSFLESTQRTVLDREEFVHERADGTQIPVEISAKTVDLGNKAYRVAIARDITDRKEQERQLRTLLGNLPGIAYRCQNEPGWPMETVRGRCQELVGYAADEIESGLVSWGRDIIHPDDRERIWDAVQKRIQRDEPFQVAYRIRTADNNEKWVWERGQAVYPHGTDSPRLEGFISDITSRKKLEEGLRASKERYESLFNSIRDAIVVADTDRRITDCNPAFTDLFGYELADIEGEPTKFLYASDEEFEAMGQAIRVHIGDPEFTYMADYEKKSGRVFPGETNVFYLRDTDGEIVGFIGLIRDVSDRIERTRQLRVIDRILRHNLRNDMNVIRGYGDELRHADDDEIDRFADVIVNRSNALIETANKEQAITDCLTREPTPQAVDIVSITEAVVSSMRDQFPDAQLSMSGSIKGRVRAIPEIGEALGEIVENAIVHSDQSEPQVNVRIRQSNGTVIVEVSDHGPGIPDMETNVITGAVEEGPTYHGGGLGLRLVDVIVQQSDGVVRFEENDPRGSIVSIRLQAA